MTAPFATLMPTISASQAYLHCITEGEALGQSLALHCGLPAWLSGVVPGLQASHTRP